MLLPYLLLTCPLFVACKEDCSKVGQGLIQHSGCFGAQILGLADGVEDFGAAGAHVIIQLCLVALDLIDGNLGQEVLGGCIDDADLQLDVNGRIAVLLEDFNDALALGQTGLGIGIQVGAELGEGLQLSVLGIDQLERAR